MKILELNKNQILEYQQNRDPYLMIDHANKVIPEKSLKVTNIYQRMNGF